MERQVTYANVSRANLDGTTLFWMRGKVQRGERGQAENSVTRDHTTSDIYCTTVTPVSDYKT